MLPVSGEKHMAHRIRTTIQKIEAKPGQRLKQKSQKEHRMMVRMAGQLMPQEDLLKIVEGLIEVNRQNPRKIPRRIDNMI